MAMRTFILFFLLLTFNLTHAQVFKEMMDEACECIKEIPNDLAEEALYNAVSGCIDISYENHPDTKNTFVDGLLNDNPEIGMEELEDYIDELLADQLVKSCPRFLEIVTVIASAADFEDSSEMVMTFTDALCEEFNNLEDLEINNEILEVIFGRVLMQYQFQLMEEIDIDDEDQMGEFGESVGYRLMIDCETFREYGLKEYMRMQSEE